MTQLKNKKVLITGASGEIGASISRLLHKNGCELCISGTRDVALEGLVNELNTDIHMVCSNLDDPKNAKTLVEEADAKMNGIDILVNNAGITKDNIFLRMTDDDWDRVMNVNLKASMILMRAVLKQMIKTRWGRIINVTSVVASIGNPGQANYVASKAGLVGVSKSVAKEVANRGVTVNCVAPGFISSPMTDKLTDDQKAKILENIPMKCMGNADDVAEAVLFLASSGARYITGETMHVNGGMAML